LTIPVIGNGDIFTAEDALKMKKETKCDGIMVGRGIQGNPWLLREINYLFKYQEYLPPPTPQEKIETIIKHFRLMVLYKGEHIATLEMRKHACWYLKGMPNGAKYKNLINHATKPEDIEALLYRAFLPNT